MTKPQFEAALAATTFAQIRAEQQLAAAQVRIDNAIATFKRMRAENTKLRIKLCGQIKRGNLLRARIAA